jgi:outer membrane protein assembly factor BamA
VQPRYGHAEVFAAATWLDEPGYPTSGGAYRLGLTTFHDFDQTAQSFRRVDADLTQYVPVFHHNWILAVRGRLALSQTREGDQVPFYLMPSLGGHTSLRGYDDYRFRDRNAALLSAEYRWPVFRMLDASLFVDAGSVSPTVRGLKRARRARDLGVGLTFHTPAKSVAGIEFAKGREGSRVFLSLTKSLGHSNSPLAPYVP